MAGCRSICGYSWTASRPDHTLARPEVSISVKSQTGGANMPSGSLVEARVWDSWQMYQDALLRTLAPLTAEQLDSRLVPGMRSVGEIAEHIVRGRALHVHHAL